MHGGLPGWTRQRRGWRGQGRGARRGALAEQAGVRSGGSEPVEWVVECSGVRREADPGMSTKS